MEYAIAIEAVAALGLLTLLIRERSARAALRLRYHELSRDFWNLVSREDEFERLGRQRRESLDRYNAKQRAKRAAKK